MLKIRLNADIVIIGGGSGGTAAAWSAAVNAPDKKIILIEAQNVLGGTSTLGGVNAWEPGCVGNSRLHYILYNRLSNAGKAQICRYTSVNRDNRYLVAHVERADNLEYEDTFRRKSPGRLVFDGEAMKQELVNCLYTLPNLKVLTGWQLVDVRESGGRITEVTVCDISGGECMRITAPLYIDATAEIVLSRMAGCRTELSVAPNGVSQMYVVQKKQERGTDKIPDWVMDTEAVEWIQKNQPDTIFNHYPDGRLNANTLSTLEGEEYRKFGVDAKRIAVARTYMMWNVLQKECGMDDHRLSYIFPMLGVREGYRLIGKYVLTEEELAAGHSNQQRKEHFIAVADHAIDVHKKEAVLHELNDYYGVPYECTLTNEIENMAVASRGISLTQIAAASCRLQRTIMQIGESVGRAAANCTAGSFYQENIFMTVDRKI